MEKWKDIPGWRGRYQASDLGRVRSLDRKVRKSDGTTQLWRGRVLRLGKLKNGYLMVSFTAPKRDRVYAYVHDLVLLAFEGRKPKGKEVRHLDGTRDNNRLTNLCYGTRSENAKDRIVHGTIPDTRGEKASSAKLSDKKIAFIRANHNKMSMRAMARKFGVVHRTISAAIHRTSWGHI